jgi:hypothetical protein
MGWDDLEWDGVITKQRVMPPACGYTLLARTVPVQILSAFPSSAHVCMCCSQAMLQGVKVEKKKRKKAKITWWVMTQCR